MPRYVPSPVPFDVKDVPRYLAAELRRIGDALADPSEAVFYRTIPVRATSLSMSAAVSANWRVAGNVLLVSTSNTLTLTGLQRSGMDGNREVVFYNVGTGVLALKSEGTESSASNRFLLPSALWNLSANAAATLWRDPFAARWRGLNKS